MTKTIEYNGTHFYLNFSFPKDRQGSTMPCRALVTPLNPETGKKITKRQLYGKDSDYPINKALYGKNPTDIETQYFPTAANELIVQMRQTGLLEENHPDDPSAQAHDLAALANSFKEMFFALHSKDWSKRTSDEYQRQYDVLAGELSGVMAETLAQDSYLALQESICRNALQTSRKKSAWKMGDEAPSSAQKRLNLLYLLIWDLKTVEGYNIPLIPTRYSGKPSRQDLLLSHIDSARSIPFDLLQQVCKDNILSNRAGILLDTGLRISEYGGLLFCSIGMVDGSQGPMYYLRITGQLQPDSKRTEIPKTDPSYRVVPLSKELGEMLMARQKTLEQQYGDISLLLLCGNADADNYCTTPESISKYMNGITELVPNLLRDPQIVDTLKESRPYRFDAVCQDKYLLSMLTCHALRRNFCTWLYCESGANTKSIYQQMGHADKSVKRRSGAFGATSSELYRMCLQKHVSRTLYHPAHPLQYRADGKVAESEVAACQIELILPPGSRWELIIEETEPLSHTSFSGDVLWKQERQDDNRNTSYDSALLADARVYTIRSKRKLFE